MSGPPTLRELEAALACTPSTFGHRLRGLPEDVRGPLRALARTERAFLRAFPEAVLQRIYAAICGSPAGRELGAWWGGQHPGPWLRAVRRAESARDPGGTVYLSPTGETVCINAPSTSVWSLPGLEVLWTDTHLEDAGNSRSGSHNLVVGASHDYVSFGGVVFGYDNRVAGPYAGVLGGRFNRADGSYAAVLGGYYDNAIGDYSTVAGGYGGFATGTNSSIAGGTGNVASGTYASALGGSSSVVSGSTAVVVGGSGNLADGSQAVVVGGYTNTASGTASAILGGEDNVTLSDTAQTVSGGAGNTVTAYAAGVVGGTGRTVSTPYGD